MSGEPRKKLKRWEGGAGPRFITFSCQNRLPLFANSRIEDVFVAAMVKFLSRDGVKLHAWVIMPEHVHLLVAPTRSNPLWPTLAAVKKSVAVTVLAKWRDVSAPILTRISDRDGKPRFWQPGGGFDRNVRDEIAFCKAVHYIHNNPVERGLVTTPAAWRCTSVRWWRGECDNEVPCDIPESLKSWRGFE